MKLLRNVTKIIVHRTDLAIILFSMQHFSHILDSIHLLSIFMCKILSFFSIPVLHFFHAWDFPSFRIICVLDFPHFEVVYVETWYLIVVYFTQIFHEKCILLWWVFRLHWNCIRFFLHIRFAHTNSPLKILSESSTSNETRVQHNLCKFTWLIWDTAPPSSILS